MTDIGDGRALRVCDLCGGVDDHPRHVLAGKDEDTYPKPGEDILNRVLDAAPKEHRARLVADLMDTSSSDRHLDCCALAGCPTDTCGPQVKDAPGTGLAMLEHVMSLDETVFAGRDDVVRADSSNNVKGS